MFCNRRRRNIHDYACIGVSEVAQVDGSSINIRRHRMITKMQDATVKPEVAACHVQQKRDKIPLDVHFTGLVNTDVGIGKLYNVIPNYFRLDGRHVAFSMSLDVVQSRH